MRSNTVIIIFIGVLVLGLIALLAYVSYTGESPGTLIAGLTLLWGSIRAKVFGRGINFNLNEGRTHTAIPQANLVPANVQMIPTGTLIPAPTVHLPAAPVQARAQRIGLFEQSTLNQVPTSLGIPDKFSAGNSRYVWLLDNGHGGLINGEYQTAGKRSPTFEDGSIVYEGVFNRDVVNLIAKKCVEKGIDYEILVPSPEDVSLGARTRKANQIHASESRKCIYVSVHANAFSPHDEEELDFNSARGIETFYFKKNSSESLDGKKAAEVFQKHLLAFTNLKDRKVKGANFFVLRNTQSKMVSVLTENGFMTNREEARLLLDPVFKEKVADAHIEAMLEIDTGQLFG